MQELSLLETKGIQLSALISELQDTFPPTNPQPSDDYAQIMYRSGQRSVVEWLLKQMEENYVHWTT